MRRYDYEGGGVAVAATTAQTLVFTQSLIPSEQIVAYHVAFTGANNDLGALTRIRVSANGSPIINITPTQLIAWANTFSLDQAIMSASDARFTIPLHLMMERMEAAQDVCQFPRGATVQIELVTDNSTSAGRCFVGWTETSISPVYFPRCLASQMNVGASVAQGRFAFGESGIVRGLYLPHTGLQRMRAVVAQQQVANLPSLDFQGATTGDLLAEVARMMGAGQTPAVPFLPITAQLSAPISGSFVELQTGSGWAGAANELAVYAVGANAPGAAAAANAGQGA